MNSDFPFTQYLTSRDGLPHPAMQSNMYKLLTLAAAAATTATTAATSSSSPFPPGWQDTPPAHPQSLSHNASHPPYTPASASRRIAEAGLPPSVADTVLTAINFERSNWAGTSVRLDPFYAELPPKGNWSALPPGEVLKVEDVTDTSLYTIPPTTALSRMLFTTRTLNGTVVPASAYVLWPWLPRRFNGDGDAEEEAEGAGLPVISWAHGTSGWSGECAPSHIRHLWYQFMITTAATQGYVVVAPDYAGLGVDHDGEGGFIAQQYLANQAHGNDLLYSVKAAGKAWEELGERFVVMGHSQGGGAAWGAAQVLADDSRDDIDFLRRGYLGTVAGSPWTSLNSSVTFQPTGASRASIVARVATGLSSIYPDFRYSDWLTDLGVRAIELMQDLQGCQAIAAQLLTRADMLRPDWDTATWYYAAWDALTSVVGKPVRGPLLVIQGDGDAAVNATGVRDAVAAACDVSPDESVEYVEHAGVGHTPIMFSAQQTWLAWVADRFEGKAAEAGCRSSRLEPLRKPSSYQFDRNWLVEWSEYSYVLA